MTDRVSLYILRASGRLEPYRNDLEQTIQGAIAKTAACISLHLIDMVVCDDPRWVIRGFGHGGRTYNPYTVQISLDPVDASKNPLIIQINAQSKEILFRSPGF